MSFSQIPCSEGSKDVPVDFIVKLGGSAITDKNVFAQSKTNEIQHISKILKMCRDKQKIFIIVHGAGSFGHHEAKEYEVNSGYLTSNDPDKVKLGFSKVRTSLIQLTGQILQTLVAEGVPAVVYSPCGSWQCADGEVTRDDCDGVLALLRAGFVPILHGDCVLDSVRGCAILSGDTIIQMLCRKLCVKSVIFGCDVKGVYDKSPQEKDAVLLPEIHVSPGGNLSVPVCISDVSNDVTGGLRLKLQSAVNIVKDSSGQTTVLICGVTSDAFRCACTDALPTTNQNPASGTLLKMGSDA